MVPPDPFDPTFGPRHYSKDTLGSSHRILAELRVADTPFDMAATAIFNLYGLSPRVRTISHDHGIFRPKDPPHGFTTYQLDWDTATLPLSLVKFFAQGKDGLQNGQRLNIFTQVFRTERIEVIRYGDLPKEVGLMERLGHILFPTREEVEEEINERTTGKPRVKIPDDAVTYNPVGEDMHYILQMFMGDNMFETKVKRGGYYQGGWCGDLMTSPDLSMEVRYLPVVDGRFKLDDPGNFVVENMPLAPQQEKLISQALTFAASERRRQM